VTCKLGWAQISKRMQQRTYTGPLCTVVGSVSNYSYAYSDIVPQNRYWLLFKASISQDTQNSLAISNLQSSLFLLNQTAQNPGASANNAPYSQQAIFLSRKSGVNHTDQLGNAGPINPAWGMKLDENTAQDGVDSGAGTGWTTPFEVMIFGRSGRPLVIPEKFGLLGSNWLDIAIAQPPNPNIQLTLKILMAEFQNTEEVTL
jgi:hypothetical protein